MQLSGFLEPTAVERIHHTLLQKPDMGEEAYAFAEIEASIDDGFHLGTEFTAKRFHQELWEPRTWSILLNGWLNTGKGSDEDRAYTCIEKSTKHLLRLRI